MLRFTLVATGLVALPACNAVWGITSLTLAEGGAGSDASSVEGGVPDAIVDGPADASSPHDWCATLTPRPAFCDDFDVGKLGARWASTLEAFGAVALDPSRYVSKPSSLRATIDALDAGVSGAQAALTVALNETPGHDSFAFDFYIAESDDTEPYPKFASLGLVNGYTLVIQRTPDLSLEIVETYENVARNTYVLSTAVADGEWIHLELVTDPPSGGSGIASFTGLLTFADGGLVKKTFPADPAGAASGPVTLSVGMFAIDGPSKPWRVQYDDVVFMAKP